MPEAESDSSFFTRAPAGNRESGDGSTIRGVSVRAWITLMVIATICGNHMAVSVAALYNAVVSKDFANIGSITTITEPLYSVSLIAIGFYFGKSTSRPETPAIKTP